MSSAATKTRLDQALVNLGLVVTRARARDIILRGEVSVNGAVAIKPAIRVSLSDDLTLMPGAGDYISRGALKLKAALEHFHFDARGRVALDIGASTGGFTGVLIEQHARRVYAVDNGRDQLHPALKSDARVVSLEETDARLLTHNEIPEPVEAIVADVSFISLTKALPAALDLAAPGCWLAALIKPQFEADPENIPRHGIVENPAIHATACERVQSWLATQRGWQVLGVIPSPIKGGDGNIEFLIGARYAA